MSNFWKKQKNNRYSIICPFCNNERIVRFIPKGNGICRSCARERKLSKKFAKLKKVVNEEIRFDERNFNCLNYPECLDEAAKLDMNLVCKGCKKYEAK